MEYRDYDPLNSIFAVLQKYSDNIVHQLIPDVNQRISGTEMLLEKDSEIPFWRLDLKIQRGYTRSLLDCQKKNLEELECKLELCHSAEKELLRSNTLPATSLLGKIAEEGRENNFILILEIQPRELLLLLDRFNRHLLQTSMKLSNKRIHTIP